MTRIRTRLGDPLGGRHIGNNVSAQNVTKVVMPTYTPFSEYTEDELHPSHPYSGGPFERLYSKLSYPTSSYGKVGVDYLCNGRLTAQYYEGMLYATFGPVPSLPLSRKLEALTYGPAGWTKASPLKPDVGLGQFIAEIREQPKAVYEAVKAFAHVYKRGRRRWLTKPSDPRSVIRCFGNQYLGYYFGWVPFVKDLDDWYRSVIDIDRRVANLRNNNCKWQRRRATVFRVSDEVKAPLYGLSFMKPSLPVGYATFNSGTQTTVTESECWFSGKLKYYIPGLDSPNWGRAKAIQKLWDLDITPRLVYQLTPFSWLIDWFTGFGTMLNNWQQITDDHLVAKYAYIMLHKVIKSTREVSCTTRLLHGTCGAFNTYTGHHVSAQTVQESKTRVTASPFGFNFNSNLSDWQLSILAALGLQKIL